MERHWIHGVKVLPPSAIREANCILKHVDRGCLSNVLPVAEVQIITNDFIGSWRVLWIGIELGYALLLLAQWKDMWTGVQSQLENENPTVHRSTCWKKRFSIFRNGRWKWISWTDYFTWATLVDVVVYFIVKAICSTSENVQSTHWYYQQNFLSTASSFQIQ